MKGHAQREHPDFDHMGELARSHREGEALPRLFYTSEAVYEHDIDAFWNESWIWVGHASEIPAPGDFFLFDYGPESIIVTRDRGGDIRALVNVCRHRGSRVCLERSGNASRFVCPYHAWTYDLHGRLLSGRAMEVGFDPDAFGLLRAELRVFQGLVFISLADDPPPIDAPLKRLSMRTSPFGLDNLKVVHKASYPVPANWKLALENYLECYHCAPAHKEYSRSHSLKDPASMTPELVSAMQEKSQAAGLPTDEVNETGGLAEAWGTDIYYRRYPLYPGYLTGSQDGAPLAPLLGSLTDFDGGATDIQIGILNNFLAYSDHVVGYRFVPRSSKETDIQIVWMVRADAEEGRDYDMERLTWLWHVTSLDDERIIRHNQAGVNSHRFLPGPLSSMEWGIEGFYQGYLATV
ncbi:MAG: aromatic ring-hydroxylating oxygenase subunit alpha [Geminicoccaceae bacterium]